VRDSLNWVAKRIITPLLGFDHRSSGTTSIQVFRGLWGDGLANSVSLKNEPSSRKVI
jgi:hypothetical protein